jgi:aerobic carbon-monoxide dehydrogenase large subunit
LANPVVRKEDDPLLRGNGRYVADMAPRGTLHAVVVRSPHAHALLQIDARKTRAMTGVRLVLTGAETNDLGLLPCAVEFPGIALKVPPYPILARAEARHVGGAVAFVVADTLERAKDGAEALAVAWQPLPHVIGAVAALKPGAPLVWPQSRDNIVCDVTLGDATATTQAFARAAKVASLTLVNQRVVANYLDTRGVVAEYDAAHGRFTLTLSSQGPHAIRDVLTEILHVPAGKIHVITPDVGGGFGTKLFCYREYALAVFAAQLLREPVT